MSNKIGNEPPLFSTLYRWTSRQQENFTTDSFVIVLKHLIRSEPKVAEDLLTKLCGYNFEGVITQQKIEITIDTQQDYEEGRPDIKIETSNLLAFIEVKKDSGLEETQLSRYALALSRLADQRITKLILLTQFPVSIPEHKQAPDLHWRWQDVADWLVACPIHSDLAGYMRSQFVAFLKGEQMILDQVAWQYIEGYKAFRNLNQMIAKAIENCKFTDVKTSAGAEWTGYDIEDKIAWVGISHHRHSFVLFEIQSRTGIDIEKLKSLEIVHEIKDKLEIRLDLEAEETCFFSKGKDSQLALITDFIRKAHQSMNSCKVVK